MDCRDFLFSTRMAVEQDLDLLHFFWNASRSITGKRLNCASPFILLLRLVDRNLSYGIADVK